MVGVISDCGDLPSGVRSGTMADSPRNPDQARDPPKDPQPSAERRKTAEMERTGQQPAKRDALPDEVDEEESPRRSKVAAEGAVNPPGNAGIRPKAGARVDRHVFDRETRP